MAKAFIRSLLERTIGRYVETDVAALNVAFWQGKIDLKDLRIRKVSLAFRPARAPTEPTNTPVKCHRYIPHPSPHAYYASFPFNGVISLSAAASLRLAPPPQQDVVDSLGLPLVVEAGSAVAHVRVDVPWRHLSTKPVRVRVTGVRLRCALRADFDDPEELLRVGAKNKHEPTPARFPCQHKVSLQAARLAIAPHVATKALQQLSVAHVVVVKTCAASKYLAYAPRRPGGDGVAARRD